MRTRIRLKQFLRRTATRFLRREDGQIAILFALGATAFVILMGMAVDYMRMSRAQTALQNAADAAVLSIAREAQEDISDEALEEMAFDRIATMVPSQYDFEVTSLTTSSGALDITVEGSLPAGLTSLAGYEELNQSATAQAVWGTGKLEVALVLDSTGSMAQHSRMTELKKAAAALLNELETSEEGLVKIAIVPFDVNVRVPTSYRTASWFRVDWWVGWFWSGCIADRDQPNDASDAAVVSTATKYPGAICGSSNLQVIQPLTDDFEVLRTKVNALNPAGNTNITIGLAWGMALLSSREPFTEGVPPGTKDVTKIIVLMTDGDNTENRWSNSGSTIDARTSAACQSAKGSDIVLYTIRLMEGDQDLLEGCASGPENYYDVENVSDLVPVFQAIGERLSRLRLAS
jgi:Flp pilus assembly protein TadG